MNIESLAYARISAITYILTIFPSYMTPTFLYCTLGLLKLVFEEFSMYKECNGEVLRHGA
jgi:hypothetical protein